MLTMTERASSVVQMFTASSQTDRHAGVRIARGSSSSPLQVRAVPGPQPSDVVVEEAGGRLFLGPEAVRRLRDSVLDVRTDAAGRVEFFVTAA